MSFDDAIAFAQAIMSDCDTPILDRLKRAHDHEIKMVSKAEYARGYEDGRRSKDADHAAVAMRLRGLRFDGGSHENLHKIAYAIYPCATGWTVESSKGLRDRLIDLLGGVHEHRCDSGRGCACGNSRAGGYGELAKAMTYDVLGNERHKVVCELRKWEPDEDGMPHRELWEAVMGEKLPTVPLNGDAELDIIMRDRLIHLLGGDEPNFTDIAETIKSGDECEDKLMENGENHKIATIADELRKYVAEIWDGSMYVNRVPMKLRAIADRMDEQFARVCELWERTATDTAQSVHDSMEAECNKLQAECDRLTAALDELHADPANDVICRLERERDELQAKLEEADAAIANWREREMSFNESERLREKLQDELKELEEFEPDIAMIAYGDDNDELRRLLYRAAKLLANAEQERDANYVYWMDCKEKVVQANVTIDELQDKLDAIREALDGNR